MLKIKPHKFSYKPIRRVSRSNRRGYFQIKSYLPSQTLRAIGPRIIQPYFVFVVTEIIQRTNLPDLPHPLTVRVNWVIENKTVFSYTSNRRHKLSHMFGGITRLYAQKLNMELKNQNSAWRVMWYSMGVSKQRNELYSLVTLRHVDPMLEVLMTE